jgi:hypothetical protein
MDLRQFVSETLSQIAGGIEDARKSIGDTARINPRLHRDNDTRNSRLLDNGEAMIQEVEFDVALTVSTATGTAGKVSVIAGILNLDTGGKSSDEKGQTSRVKFRVPISFPKG